MKYLPLVLLSLFTIVARSQEKESFYVFDADWKPTKIDSAHFLLHVHQMNDTCWQYDYYNFAGPLIKSERYKDREGNLLHGDVRYYNGKGWTDSIGNYRMGKKNGDFYRLSEDSLHFLMKYVYKDDVLIETVDISKDDEDDSASIARGDKESEYPGGPGQWLRYIGKHIKYPERAINIEIQGEVRVVFIVEEDGRIEEPRIARSIEYSVDEESLRIIRGSGKWIPSVEDGKHVKSYKIQPVVFRLQ